MGRLTRAIMSFVAVIGIGTLVFAAPAVGAVGLDEACADNPDASICQSSSNNDFGAIMKVVINTLLFIVGAVSVIVVIIGGIMYTTSAGDSSGVTRAKNTILGAVIGLVVAFLGYAIVNFVVERLFA